MTERKFPDQLTPVPVSEMYAALRDAWRQLRGAEPSRASLLVLLAHWALETDRGKECHCFNIGNAKHTPGDGRDYCQFRCEEVLGGKKVWFDPPHPATSFRAFETLTDGVMDYMVLLIGQFGFAWPAVEAGDATEFCRRLKTKGYYTADVAEYTSGVVRCLKELDKEIGPDTVPDAAPFAHVAIQEASLSDDESGRDPPDEPPQGAA